jgi:hypothetical protein
MNFVKAISCGDSLPTLAPSLKGLPIRWTVDLFTPNLAAQSQAARAVIGSTCSFRTEICFAVPKHEMEENYFARCDLHH